MNMVAYPVTPWETMHKHLIANWRQGEHMAVVGPTGVGKTTFLREALDARTYVVVFCSKVHDDVLADFPGFEVIEKWPPKVHQNKVLLWPKPVKKERFWQPPRRVMKDTKAKQKEVFADAMDRIFLEGNWTVGFDEQHYLCQDLGLMEENATFQHQGRSSGLTIVNGTQRPAWVPVVTYSSATHAVLWKNTVDDDLKRLANLGGISKRELEYNLLTLDKHSFVYVNTRNGDVFRSKVER